MEAPDSSESVIVIEPDPDAAGDEVVDGAVVGTEAAAEASAGGDALSTTLVAAVLEAQAAREAKDAETAERAAVERIHGVVIGRVVKITERGPLVRYRGCPALEGLIARAAAPVTSEDIGRRAALMFEGGASDKPILTGLLHFDDEEGAHPAGASFEITEDDQKIDIKLKKAISLRCGQTTILITPSGKIVLKGKYLLSRATGINRVQGGAVRIN